MGLIKFVLYRQFADEKEALKLTVEHPFVPLVGEDVTFSTRHTAHEVTGIVRQISHCVNSAACHAIVFVNVYRGDEHIDKL